MVMMTTTTTIKSLATILVIFFVLNVVTEAEEEQQQQQDHVLVLTGKNFTQILEENDNVMVEFYAPWCGHCKAFEPDYIKIAAILKEHNQNVVCAKVDAPEEQNLIEKYDIQGFPTLKLFRKEKEPLLYHGFRSVDTLVDWIERKIGPAAQTLKDQEQALAFKDSADVVLVGYFKDDTSNETQTFMEVADQFDDFKFALVTDESVASKLDIPKEGIVLFKKFDEGRVEYDGEAKSSNELKQFIQANSLPLVITFDQSNAQKIFGGDIKAHNLLFIGKSDARYSSIVEEFRLSAKQFKAIVLHVIIDSDQEEHERIIDYFGLKKEELPGLRFIKLQDEMTKYKYDHQDMVADKIISFVQGVLDGNIKPHLLTQELPSNWNDEPVKVLVGTNFDDVVMDKSKDVLVEFYAPWCGHCKALAPIYDQLGEKFKDHDTIVVAKIDAAANELEHTKINSYPTIKLYKRETNEAVEYNGERTLEGLSKFLETNGDYGRAAPDEMIPEVEEVEPDLTADKHDEL